MNAEALLKQIADDLRAICQAIETEKENDREPDKSIKPPEFDKIGEKE